MLNTQPMPAAAAERYCNSMGAHLVSYTSLAEQAAVEEYFVSQVGSSCSSVAHIGLSNAHIPCSAWASRWRSGTWHCLCPKPKAGHMQEATQQLANIKMTFLLPTWLL